MDKDSLFKRIIKGVFTNPPSKPEPGYEFEKATGTIKRYIQPEEEVEELIIPEEIEGVVVTTIGSEAFANCDKLISVIIPVGVTTIGEHAFANCDKLTNVALPPGLTSIGDFAFNNCINLESMLIPYGVTTINKAVFANCTNLSKLAIHPGVTSIGMNATLRCFNLTIHGTEGSCAHAYATENRIPFKALKLRTGYSVNGKVLDKFGNRMPGVTFKLGEDPHTTDQEGKFKVGSLSGTVVIKPMSDEGYKFSPSEIKVSGPGTDICFEASYSIVGRVKDKSGKGIEGVSFSYGEKSFATGSDGSFKIPDISGQAVLKPVSTQNYIFTPTDVTVLGPSTDLTFEAYCSVSGSIKDGKGDKMPGFRFALDGETLVTDPLGNFVIPAISGTTVIRPSSPDGYYFKPSEVTLEGPGEDISFEVFYEISGYVMDEDGNGIEGATVSAQGRKALSDAEGAFKLSGMTGNIKATVTKDGLKFLSDSLDVTGPSSNIDFVAQMPVLKQEAAPAGPDMGLEPEAAEAAKEAKVTMEAERAVEVEAEEPVKMTGPEEATKAEETMEEPTAKVTEETSRVVELTFTTDSEGIFNIPNISGRTIIRPVSSEGYIFTPSEIVITGPEDEIYFEVSYNVSGHVKDEEGNGIPGATISAGDRSVTSSADGSYLLTGLSGEATVVVNKDGCSFKTGEAQVKGPSSGIEFTAYSIVAGRVTDAFGVGIADVLVSGEGKSARTGADGSYALMGVSGRAKITAAKDGYAFNPDAIQITGLPHGIDFVGEYFITGRVAFSDGTGIAGVTVSAGANSTVTGDDGTYSLNGLSGTAGVSASKDKYNFSPPDKQITGPGQGIDFTGGYNISGRIVDVRGKGIGGVAVMIGGKQQKQ